MDQTIAQIAADRCCGCGACGNKCPKDAIRMELNEEGFYFPQIDERLCVQCGLCLQACPVNRQPSSENFITPECYAVMASDKIRGQSSSGGVFSLLANWALEQGGCVVGAAYTDDCYGVEHLLIDREDQLPKLRGSKYVQSDTALIYRQVKAELERGRVVLFTGTPCHVAAVYAYLGKSYSNLYTVEIVCHGVPAPELFKQFVKEQEASFGSKAIAVNMRDKSIASWDPALSITFANEQQGRWKRNESSYLKIFLSATNIRPSCGQCLFARLPRTADLSIADFWDIHRLDPSLDDRKGTSAVLVNNARGQDLLEKIKKATLRCELSSLEHAIKYNAQMAHSSRLNVTRRERLYRLMKEYGFSFEKAVDYVVNDKYDIGYVGWWYGTNYGSALTSFALHRVLKTMGKTILMLDFPVMAKELPQKKADSFTRRFARRFYEMSPMTKIGDYRKYNQNCETFLVGSDQLWNWWSNRDVGTWFYFLDFVAKEKKKIAYATSFGHESAYYPDNMRLRLTFNLQRFDAISIREKSGVMTCQRIFNTEATHTIDPVFLCDIKEYEAVAKLSTREKPKQYVIAYILNPTEEKRKIIQSIAKGLGLPYQIMLDGQADHNVVKAQMNDPNVLDNVGIEDWVSFIRDAQYVVTDSYHGFCFSIIFNRPMTVIPNTLRGMARFLDMAELTGLGCRFESSVESVEKHKPWQIPIDFVEIERQLGIFKKQSSAWLRQALDAPKTPVKGSQMHLWKTIEHDARISKLEKNTELSMPQAVLDELQELRQAVLLLDKKLREYTSFANPNEADRDALKEKASIVDKIADLGVKGMQILEDETVRLIAEKKNKN